MARPLLRSRRPDLALCLGLLLSACLGGLPESGATDRPAGASCAASTECASLICGAGTCTGGNCDCPLVGGCDEAGTVDPDCERGWLCVKSTLGQLIFEGSCKLPCSAGCPAGWVCESDSFCAYHRPDPMVSAQAEPPLVFPAQPIHFSAEASSENGEIRRYFWDFQDGETGEGQSVDHSYQRVGRFSVQVTAEDSVRALGSTSVAVQVCYDRGTACPESSGCCEGLYCLQDGPGLNSFTCGACAAEAQPCNVNQGGDRQCCDGLRCLPSAPNQTACLSCRPEGAPCEPAALGQCCEGLRCDSGPGFGAFCGP